MFTNPILNISFSYYLVFTYVLQDTLNYENLAQVKIINGIVEIKYKVYGYLVCLATWKQNWTTIFHCKKRDWQTLLPIIESEVGVGAINHSDQCQVYRTLKDPGLIHQTVNHTEYIVYPITGEFIFKQ